MALIIGSVLREHATKVNLAGLGHAIALFAARALQFFGRHLCAPAVGAHVQDGGIREAQTVSAKARIGEAQGLAVAHTKRKQPSVVRGGRFELDLAFAVDSLVMALENVNFVNIYNLKWAQTN